MFRCLYLAVLLSLGLSATLPAQHPMGHTAAPKAAGGGGAPGNGKNRRTIVDKWNRMSPEERQKALEKLPPERRQKIEQALNEYRSLTPEQRRQLRSRLETFNQLPPEKQNQARRLFRQFSELPPDRRPQLRSEFESLRAMPEADRRARLNSDEFRSKYNEHEQKFLRDLSGLVTPAN
jgi:Protein of unknown function (DUF3106)